MYTDYKKQILLQMLYLAIKAKVDLEWGGMENLDSLVEELIHKELSKTDKALDANIKQFNASLNESQSHQFRLIQNMYDDRENLLANGYLTVGYVLRAEDQLKEVSK